MPAATDAAISTPIDVCTRAGMKARRRDRPAVAGGGQQEHLRDGGVGDVAEPHQRPGEQADALDRLLQARSAPRVRRASRRRSRRTRRRAAARPASRCRSASRGARRARRRRCPVGSSCAPRAGGHLDLDRRPRCPALRRSRRRRRSRPGRPGVAKVCVARSPVFTSRMRTVVASAPGATSPRSTANGPIPASRLPHVCAVAHGRLIDADLQEQVVDVDIRLGRARHDRDLAGEGMSAAEPVDLRRVGAAHDPQQEVVALGGIGREVLGEEVGALRRAPAHEHAADAVAHRVSDRHPRIPPATCRSRRGRRARRAARCGRG